MFAAFLASLPCPSSACSAAGVVLRLRAEWGTTVQPSLPPVPQDLMRWNCDTNPPPPPAPRKRSQSSKRKRAWYSFAGYTPKVACGRGGHGVLLLHQSMATQSGLTGIGTPRAPLMLMVTAILTFVCSSCLFEGAPEAESLQCLFVLMLAIDPKMFASKIEGWQKLILQMTKSGSKKSWICYVC